MKMIILLPSLSSETDLDKISFRATELLTMHQFKDCHMTSGAKLKLEPTIKVIYFIKC